MYEQSSGRLLGTRLVDAGGGYCSQGATPVHFGLGGDVDAVRVEVTIFRHGARVIANGGKVDLIRRPRSHIEVRAGS